MIRKLCTSIALPATVAAVLLFAGSAEAQRYGGYRGYSGYGGFVGYGGYSYGNGFYSPGYGGYYSPWVGSYSSPYGYGYNYQFANPRPNWGVYASPQWNSYTSYPNYSTYVAPNYSYQSFYPPDVPSANTSALLTIRVPAEADVFFDDQPATKTGAIRTFESPPLTPGKNYSYEIKARWTENGAAVERTRKVPIRAGSRVNVDFTTGE